MQQLGSSKRCSGCYYLGHVDNHCSKCFKRKDHKCNPICRNTKSPCFDSRIKDPKVEMCGRHSTVKTSDPYVLHGVEWQDEQDSKTDSKGASE